MRVPCQLAFVPTGVFCVTSGNSRAVRWKEMESNWEINKFPPFSLVSSRSRKIKKYKKPFSVDYFTQTRRRQKKNQLRRGERDKRHESQPTRLRHKTIQSISFSLARLDCVFSFSFLFFFCSNWWFYFPCERETKKRRAVTFDRRDTPTSSSIGTEKRDSSRRQQRSREMFSPFGRDVFYKVTGATAFSHSDTRNRVETQTLQEYARLSLE